MPAADLARADPLPAVIAWLDAHPAVAGELGGTGRVAGTNEPPYPRLRLTDPPGDDRQLRWLMAARLRVEALGDLDGSPGKAALRRVLYVALGALKELPDQPANAGGVVITEVVSSAGGGWSPLASGQPRYLATVSVYAHPPRA